MSQSERSKQLHRSLPSSERIRKQRDLYIKLCNTFCLSRNEDGVQMTLDILKKGLKTIGIKLTAKQLAEAFVYASSTQKSIKNLEKIYVIFNFEKKIVDLKLLSSWLFRKQSYQIQSPAYYSSVKGSIDKYSLHKKRSLDRKEKGSKRRVYTDEDKKLPKLKLSRSPVERIHTELNSIIQIFDEMRKQRENYGLIPIKVDEDESDYEFDESNIPYSSQLHKLNKKIYSLKLNAEDKLKQIIAIAKQDEHLRKKLEKELFLRYKGRLQVNEKIGRYGSMKAHKRMIIDQKKQLERFKRLKVEKTQSRLNNEEIKEKLKLQKFMG